MALTAVNFDIYLAEGSAAGQYTARAALADGTGMTPQPMNLAPLLGALTLIDLYQADQTPPANPTAFVDALFQMRQGFSNTKILTTVGDGLLQALPSQVRDFYNRAWALVAGDRAKLLRVRLHFDKAELGTLPWEYLKVDDLFLCEHEQRSLIRYPESGQIVGQFNLSGPLKILVWASLPEGTEPLDFDGEVRTIEEGLKAGLGTGFQIDVVRTGTPVDLARKLRNDGYHIWHYIGHGKVDTDTGESTLLFQFKEGAPSQPVATRQLQPGLYNSPTLKLVFLNSCKTAVGSPTNAYTSMGLNLARFTPAIIAMQAAVEDDSAILLSQTFYQELSNGKPLDVCLAHARQDLIAAYGDKMDWGIPALFTRADLSTLVADDGRTSGASNTPAPASTSGGPNPTSSGTGQTGGPTPAAAATGAPDATLIRDLVDLLTDAFPSRSNLSQLTSFYLNTSLDAIPSDANDIRSLALGVVNWTQAQRGDAMARLIDGAITERSARDDLKAMRARLAAAGLLGGPATGGGTQSSGGQNSAQGASSGGTAPAIPSVEPPPVSAFSNGRLSLTPPGRRLLAQNIANSGWAATAEGRDQLVESLPPGLRGGVSRSNIAQLHINSIISTAESWGRMTGGQYEGKYALIVLAETGAALSGFGTPGAPVEAGSFMGLANAMRVAVGQPPATQPLAD